MSRTISLLPSFQGKRLNDSTPNPPFDRKEMKKKALREALARTRGNQSEAARILGFRGSRFGTGLREFGIDTKDIAKVNGSDTM